MTNSREVNGVAYRLAHIDSSIMLDETLAIIQDVLYEDLCNCSRGIGFMSPSRQSSSFVNNIGGIPSLVAFPLQKKKNKPVEMKFEG